MWWQYLLVFLGALLFDITPFPLPPAFSIMVVLQIIFHLNIWLTIIIGVAGSIIGRYILSRYIPLLATKIFNPEKNLDIQYLGKTMKEKGWKSQVAILAYSLLPLPTTPLFIAAGIAKMEPLYIIPAFFLGKFTSDTIAVHVGKYAAQNFHSLTQDLLTWKSIITLITALILIFFLIFTNWRTLLQNKKFQMDFKIFHWNK